jgi:hypothetical protein
MNTRSTEHRWGDRVRVDIPVQLIGPTRTILDGRLTNLSLSGAFIAIDAHVPVMTDITLLIRPNGRSSIRPRAIAGYVARQIQGGIGVGWSTMAPVTIAHVVSVHEAMRSRNQPLQYSRMSG